MSAIAIVPLEGPRHPIAPTPRLEAGPWRLAQIEALFSLPSMELVLAPARSAYQIDRNRVILSTQLMIKTGRCMEDCGFGS